MRVALDVSTVRSSGPDVTGQATAAVGATSSARLQSAGTVATGKVASPHHHVPLRARPKPTRLDEIPVLDPAYLSAASRAKTVIICGASSSKPGTVAYEPMAAAVSRAVVGAGGNVLTGCGSGGTMGAAYYAAADAAQAEGAGENLAIVKQPAWGDEDLANARVLATAQTEEARFDLFQKLGATLVLFPGGAGTLLEVAKAVEGAAYPRPGQPPFDTIVLVGTAFYAGLRLQLDALVEAGTMKAEVRSRFTFVDDAEELVRLATPKS